MSNTQFLVALGICISLSSTIAAAETATPLTVDNSAASQPAPTQDTTTTTESRPTLIQRSVDTIGEIGNRSIEQVTALGAKIAVNANASQPDSVKDPFEHFNRKIYSFNMKLDQYIMLPVARTYKKIVPTPVQHGVTNFFINLGMPWTAVNNLLQGHPGTSVESLSRFVINTATSLGFYDTATYLGIDRSDEDFGLTLGKWGIGSGPYVMLPFFGPSTVRDTFSRAVDQFGAPQNYIHNTWESLGITGVKFVDQRAQLIGLENFVQGDQYTLIRDVYLQKRQFDKGATSSQTSNSDDGFSNNDFGDDGFGDSDFSSHDAKSNATPQSSTAQASTSVATPDTPTDLTSASATPPAQF
ncbi:MAG: VacJ family lipoprotein [Gammaproteobacteria bacterium]|nr:VacJ family lipoprotein [Gammaproteobacteria bacterium]